MAGLEIVDLTEIVGDMSIPCDFSEDSDWCPNQPAAWILHRDPCCAAGGGVRLACDDCKEARLMDQVSLECPFCGFIYERAPDAYIYIEPLRRNP